MAVGDVSTLRRKGSILSALEWPHRKIVFMPIMGESLYTPGGARFRMPTQIESRFAALCRKSSRERINKVIREAKRNAPFTSNFFEKCSGRNGTDLGKSADARNFRNGL